MDYGQVRGIVVTSTGAGTAGLAFTGVSGIPWLLIACVTFLAVGVALLRLAPRREE